MNSSLEKSTLMSKPNFKVKRYKKVGSKKSLDFSLENTDKELKGGLILPATQRKNPEYQSKLRKSDIARNSSLISERKRLTNTMEESFDLISDN